MFDRLCETTTVKRNVLVTAIAGILFSSSWWMIIDLAFTERNLMYNRKIYYLPSISSTLALFIVNVIPITIIKESYFYSDSRLIGPFTATMILFFGLLVSFGSVIGASYILINDFILNGKGNLWPGFSVFIQNGMIFSANMLLKFGTTSENSF